MKNSFISYIIGILFLGLSFSACKNTVTEKKPSNKVEAKSEKIVDVEEKSPLNYLVREGTNPNGKVMIMMHGMGSDEKDLFSFAKNIDASWTIFSLQAPFKHTNGKFQWYKLNRQNGARDRDINDIKFSSEKLLNFLEYAKNKYKFNNKEIYIGGFSQGSIMSLYTGLSNPNLVKGMACFSGLLLEDIDATTLNETAVRNLNIFMAHGTEDKMIPIEEGRKAKAFLDSLNIPVIYKEYPMTHTISKETFIDFIDWTRALK